MNGQSYHHRPWADRVTRRRQVLKIRRLIESGRYHVSADRVAEAVLAEIGFEESDYSSCGGLDADAKQRWIRPKP